MLTIKVKASPGEEITKAFIKAVKLANKLDCYVDFDFNGVSCVACPGGDPDKGAEAYHDAIQSKKQHKFAMS